MKRIFYGWWIVGAVTIGLALSPGPVAFYSLGVLMPAMKTVYGWDQEQISLAATIMTVATFLTMPFIGFAVDRHGPRKVLIPSVLAFAATLAATAHAASLTQLYIMYALVGIGSAGANSLAYMHLLSTWFDRRRGLAIGIASAGMGVGFSVVPGLTQWLIDLGGLRLAYFGLAGLILLVGLPTAYLIIRDSPRNRQSGVDSRPLSPEASESPESGASIRQAVRMRQFWTIMVIFVLAAGSVYGIALHLVSIVKEVDPIGSTPVVAATILGMSMIFGRVAGGYLFDRFHASIVAFGIFAFGASGSLILSAVTSANAWPLIAAALVGFCSGAEGDALALLVSRYFGLRAYGKIYGHAFCATILGISTIPYLLGWGYERSGGYSEPLLAVGALLLLAAALTALLGHYPRYDDDGVLAPAESNGRTSPAAENTGAAR